MEALLALDFYNFVMYAMLRAFVKLLLPLSMTCYIFGFSTANLYLFAYLYY